MLQEPYPYVVLQFCVTHDKTTQRVQPLRRNTMRGVAFGSLFHSSNITGPSGLHQMQPHSELKDNGSPIWSTGAAPKVMAKVSLESAWSLGFHEVGIKSSAKTPRKKASRPMILIQAMGPRARTRHRNPVCNLLGPQCIP